MSRNRKEREPLDPQFLMPRRRCGGKSFLGLPLGMWSSSRQTNFLGKLFSPPISSNGLSCLFVGDLISLENSAFLTRKSPNPEDIEESDKLFRRIFMNPPRFSVAFFFLLFSRFVFPWKYSNIDPRILGLQMGRI